MLPLCSTWMAIGRRSTVMCSSREGKSGKLDGKILGCRELVVLHDAQAHPLLATTHRGDQHLTIGLPQILHCYEQATGQAQVKRVVVDREGMAAEFLAQLHQEGRQVVTRLAQ
jgi:hypothetical protein